MRPKVVAAAKFLGVILAATLGAALGAFPPAQAQDTPEAPAAPPEPATCTKVEFESAVDHAAESLRDLNNKNRPEFQAKLRQLKEKRGWNDNQFLKEAAPFVKDNEITVYDTKTNELLASISSMGQEGASAAEPNCSMLAELRGLMQVLIDTQASKWSYMFKKLDTELTK
ncbi:hypothetical protein [Hyphomicrobium sp.]|uniref:hypothetical protein n=1 Tax=Hyphomicrobium sp. TaxID=82 RepID=UPI0025BF7702|nr:hypothetical protein [Hyphomicrobium sp.]MCC7250676.1 hypothetical protein [Hyphomicrobium sp.]